MKTLIKEITSVTSQGVGFRLTEKGQLGNSGGLNSKNWFVSWDCVGRALFREQYSDSMTVAELRLEREEEPHGKA